MARRVIRQQTVPKLILRGFTERRQLKAFDREAQHELVVSINDASVFGHIYDMPSNTPGWDVDAIEKHLGVVESAAAGIAEVRKGDTVSVDNREAVAELIALQLTRTVRAWNEVHEIADSYEKVWFEGISPRRREGALSPDQP